MTTFVSLPLSYVTTSVNPSNFHESHIGLFSAHLARSSTFLVFAKDSAGNSCSSFLPATLSADTFCVGESGSIIPVSSSNFFSLSKAASHS